MIAKKLACIEGNHRSVGMRVYLHVSLVRPYLANAQLVGQPWSCVAILYSLVLKNDLDHIYDLNNGRAQGGR